MTYDKEILKLKRKIASLEAKALRATARTESTHRKKVISLAKKLGYKTVHVLYAELFKLGGKIDQALGTTDATPKKRKRRTITPAMRKAVVAGLKAGQPATKVAKSVGISLPSVNNIKKAAGLTKSKKTVKKGAPKKVVGKTARKPKTVKVKVPKGTLVEAPAATPSTIGP
jgi:hypothetical protein